MRIEDTDSFTQSYIESLLWSSDPLDGTWDDASPSPELIERAYHECKVFRYRAQPYLDAEPSQPNDDMAGHDFALTRNHHGAGFWDGDWPRYGGLLTKIADSFGEVEVYLGDDGQLHT